MKGNKMKELIFHSIQKLWYSKESNVYVLASRFGKNKEVDGFLDKVEVARTGMLSVTFSMPEPEVETVTSSNLPEPITEEDLTLLEVSEPLFEHKVDGLSSRKLSDMFDSMLGPKDESKPE
jgi:hypothetical protein